jgi:streptogramin lyase
VAWVVRTAQVDNDRALAAARAAPGTAELRALGCQTASARDDVSTTPDGAALFTVDCEVAAGTKLSCADVAKAYTKAVGKAKAPFRVTVGPSSGSEHLCTESFSTDGQPLQGKP